MPPDPRNNAETWELRFPTDQPGKAFLSRGDSVSVRLAPRFWRLLLVLLQARAEDATLPRFAAGWRSRAQIGKAMAAFAGNSVPLALDTVSTYACQLRRKLAEATREVSPEANVRLIEQESGLGHRIPDGVVIEVVYGSERRTGTSEA